MTRLRAVWLFLAIVWRQWEPPSVGIPDGYRASGRLSVALAWKVAREVWLDNGLPSGWPEVDR